MTIQDPGDPSPYDVPTKPEDDDDERSPFERPPFDRDPEAQRAPGASESEVDNPQPPMQAGGPPDEEPVGNDNIRDGTVGGVMGSPRQTMGQGQGG